MGFMKSFSSKNNNTKLGDPDEELKRCGSALATLVTITIYKQKMWANPLALHHHYLLIRVSEVIGVDLLGEDINLSELWILAEKACSRTGKFQFEVRVNAINCTEADTRRKNDFVKFSIDLKSANAKDSVKIRTDELVRILNGNNTRYTLLCSNCWEYADNTMRRLIKELVKLTKSEDMKEKLKKAASEIPTLSLPDHAFTFVLVALGLAVVGRLSIRGGILMVQMASFGLFGIKQAMLAHIFGFAQKLIWKMLESAETNNVTVQVFIQVSTKLCETHGISRTTGYIVNGYVIVFLVLALYIAICAICKEGYGNFEQVKKDVRGFASKTLERRKSWRGESMSLP